MNKCVYVCMYGYDGSTSLITYCMMPQSHQLSFNFRKWNSWGCQHGWIPSCSHQHLCLFNIFDAMCSWSYGCPTSLATKPTIVEQQSWAVWTNHKFLVADHIRLMRFQMWTSQCRLWPSLVMSYMLDGDGPPWKSLWEEIHSPAENALLVWCDQDVSASDSSP
jgi:hypothetical protein